MSMAASRQSTTEEALRTVREAVFSGILSDTLDDLGYKHSVLSPAFRPIEPAARAFGRARTIHLAPLSEGDDPNAVHGGLALLDTLRPGDLVVVAGGSMEWAYWGELMSTAARYRGAVGTVVDGMSRDSQAVRALRYPVFARGWYGRDIKGRGKVTAIDVPVKVDDVSIRPGQWIFADVDGIIVVPLGLEHELFEAVANQLAVERNVKTAIGAGELPTGLIRKFGVF